MGVLDNWTCDTLQGNWSIACIAVSQPNMNFGMLSFPDLGSTYIRYMYVFWMNCNAILILWICFYLCAEWKYRFRSKRALTEAKLPKLLIYNYSANPSAIVDYSILYIFFITCCWKWNTCLIQFIIFSKIHFNNWTTFCRTILF